MSTDRELLEAAAKAAGYDVQWHDAWRCFVHVGPFNTDNPPTLAGQRMVWAPLQNDGDALRLAAKLYLWEPIRFAHRLVGGPGCPDIYAATRRAIVEAAAAIGAQA
jgi:hypothetical protein